MVSKKTDSLLPSKTTTRIVGIGASAGGLAPLQEFIKNIPAQSGIAYIVVQHFDPKRKARLVELLQLATTMCVYEAQQDMQIQPDCIYVIPSNSVLTIVKSLIQLQPPSELRGLRLPIDTLFTSLAKERGEKAIAVVLSGMGADGTIGMQAIRAAGGLNVAQDPDTAQFDAMPRSVISTGCVDIIGPAQELAKEIVNYSHQITHLTRQLQGNADAQAESLIRMASLMKNRTRHDFSLYKPNTLLRRMERRMTIHKILSIREYIDFLEGNNQELDLLFKELLIGVTSFFRDPKVWDYLQKKILPEWLAAKEEGVKLRVWSVGCSTGEEAYSLAMAFTDALEKLSMQGKINLQIFASDISSDAIAFARKAEYPLAIKTTVPDDYIQRFFYKQESCYQINESIRDMVLFAQHDVLLDPPFTKIDFIACRNLLIYFDATLQRKLFPLFHYSLQAGGVLMLGNSETTGLYNQLFEPIEPKFRFFRRMESTSATKKEFLLMTFPPITNLAKEQLVPPSSKPPQNVDNLQSAADQILLQTFSPAAVVINSIGDIIYISGRTGNYLEPAAGKANWNFHAMVRSGLRQPLTDALNRAIKEKEAQHLYGLQVQLPGCVQHVDITVQALTEPESLSGSIMIVFREIPPPSSTTRASKVQATTAAIHSSELQNLRSEIQSLQSRARNTEEELQSANEELQSTNEELQSTNEELTTSKEEMQSMNEELQTINTELQLKVDDLSLEQSDMENLLNSVDIAILFLDQELNVRRFTDKVSKIFNLRESDVGRPLSDLATTLQYTDLIDNSFETLSTLVASEKQIATSDGRLFTVRIIPYRRIDNVIDGVVITLIDIGHSKIHSFDS